MELLFRWEGQKLSIYLLHQLYIEMTTQKKTLNIVIYTNLSFTKSSSWAQKSTHGPYKTVVQKYSLMNGRNKLLLIVPKIFLGCHTCRTALLFNSTN